jgi:dTDP-4-dehydrorhamnose 3,5-epimerase
VIFEETKLAGAFVVDLKRIEDSRGFFARAFCQGEFEQRGLSSSVAQVNLVSNRLAGTVRGVHFQYPPDGESKFVRPTRGTILDVAVDLRPESPTFLQHVAVELSADSGRALFIPARFGHAFQALEDGAELLYFASVPFASQSVGGLSPLDSELGIEWPLPVSEISAKDSGASPLAEQREELSRKMAI